MSRPARSLPEGSLPALIVNVPAWPGQTLDLAARWDFEMEAVNASARTEGMVVLLPLLRDIDHLKLWADGGGLQATAAQVLGRHTAGGFVRVKALMRVLVTSLKLPPELPSAAAEPFDEDDNPGLNELADQVRERMRGRLSDAGLQPPLDFWTARPGPLADLVAPLLFGADSEDLSGLFELQVGTRLGAELNKLSEGKPAPRHAPAAAVDAVGPVEALRTKLARAGLDPEVMTVIEQRLQSGATDAETLRRDMRFIDALPFGRVKRVRRAAQVRRRLIAEVGDVDAVGQWVLDRVPFLTARRQNPPGLGRPLLLVGPPGVGKTRRAEVMARALGLPSFTISGGGLSEALSIRGARSLFSRSQPGMIVSALIETGVMNPVVILDELDKLGGGTRNGRAADALLHVLDPEVAGRFRDDFLEFPLDLRRVLFVGTANSIDGVPGPLRDRMEIVMIEPYSRAQRRHIISRVVLPDLRREYGLDRDRLLMPTGTLEYLLDRHASEAGLRSTVNDLRTICIKTAQRSSRGRRVPMTPADLDGLLGQASQSDPDRCVVCGSDIVDPRDHLRLVASELPMGPTDAHFPVAVHHDCLHRPASYFLANADRISARVAADAVVWRWMLEPPDPHAGGQDPAGVPRL